MISPAARRYAPPSALSPLLCAVRPLLRSDGPLFCLRGLQLVEDNNPKSMELSTVAITAGRRQPGFATGLLCFFTLLLLRSVIL